MTRAEYVFGKLAILMTWLVLVTWVPAILLLVVQIAFAGNVEFFRSNLYLFPAITVFAFVQIVTVSTAMLALSSLSNSSRYVGILYAALLFFSQALFGVLQFVAGDTRLSWISVPFDLNQVGDAIFRLPLRYDTPWPLSLAVLVLLVVASAVGARAAGARRRGRRVSGAAAPVVAASHLSKWYGQVIGLNDVTVTVPPGITGLLGPERRRQVDVPEVDHRAAEAEQRATSPFSASESGAIPRSMSASDSARSRTRSTNG